LNRCLVAFSASHSRRVLVSGGLFPEKGARMTIKSRRTIRWREMEKGDIQLKDLIRYFVTYNRSDGKSPATLRWYHQTLDMLLDWLIETDRPTNLGSIDENTVREFILWLRERLIHGHKIKVTSVNNRVRALRASFNWLYHEGYTETHLLQYIKPPRLPQLIVDTLSEEEISSIMASLDRSTVTGSRNLAILAFLLDAGLILAELVGLKIQDVHLEDQYVKVMGKGSKERMVAFGCTTRNALLNYLVYFHGESTHPGYQRVFPYSRRLRHV
jgi:site-specific recombinase XerD